MSVVSVPSEVALAQFPFVGKDGKLAWSSLKIVQVWQVQLQNGLTPDGNIKGDLEPTVTIIGRGGDIESILSGLDDNGVFIGHISPAAVVDGHAGTVGSILQYLDENGELNTDHLIDGTGSPLEGGKVAYLALVDSLPDDGDVLTYNGTIWDAQPLPASTAYLKGTVTINISATSGTFYGTLNIPGATSGMACFMGLPHGGVVNGVGILGQTNASTDASGGPGDIVCEITVNGLAGAPGNIDFPVVVYP